jgi:hypothetical protein
MNGYKLLTAVNFSVFLFFVLISLYAIKCNVLIKTLDLDQDPGVNKSIINAMILLSAILQVPLTFFQVKEIVLTLYDECKNRNLS